MARRLTLLLSLVVLALCACSDDEDAPAAPAPEPANVRYVNGTTGSDGGDGSAGDPWATITHAVGNAGEDVTIRVTPATYDNEFETFPIELKPGQQLIGDVTNKGMGTTETRIRGEGVFAHSVFTGTAIVGADGARVAGFAILSDTDPNFYSGIAVVDSVVMEIDHNTFFNLYAGVGSTDNAAPDIHDNLFQARAYSLVLDGSGAVHVHDNVMEMTAYGVRYFGITGAIIEDNAITATFVGVQAASGTATIRNNRFESLNYSYGAISSIGTSPVIRGNWFAAGPALYVTDFATPDAGTIASPGQNDFSDIVGVVVQHTGSQVVTVIGNTWATYPPTIGTEIVITGTGSVVWE